jgi:hypothetical protein
MLNYEKPGAVGICGVEMFIDKRDLNLSVMCINYLQFWLGRGGIEDGKAH